MLQALHGLSIIPYNLQRLNRKNISIQGSMTSPKSHVLPVEQVIIYRSVDADPFHLPWT